LPRDLDGLAATFGVRFERGPEDLHDLPQHFGKRRRRSTSRSTTSASLPRSSTRAPWRHAILARARISPPTREIIDLAACPRRRSAVERRSRRCTSGLAVSVDSLDPAELRRAGAPAADSC